MEMRRFTILTVGNDDTYKGSVASALSDPRYWVQTATSIRQFDDYLLESRAWISANSLRRLEGCKIKVVCCMSDPFKDIRWIKTVFHAFQGHSECITVVTCDSRYETALSEKTIVVDRARIGLYTGEDELRNGAKLLVDSSSWWQIEVPHAAGPRRRIVPWSSERVILFGRTGSGKSTIAQMLTKGKIISESEFGVSDSAIGVTSKVARGEGRGWYVTDTPGFGESKEGTVSTKEATLMIKGFVRNVCGTYTHFIYVMKKDRLCEYDRRLWKFFTTIFSEAEENFTVVVTRCDRELSAEDDSKIRSLFAGCKSVIYVDFPPVSNDSELEEENIETRTESLEKLEDALAKLYMTDKTCDEGEFSRDSLTTLKSSLHGASYEQQAGIVGDLFIGTVYHLLLRPLWYAGRNLAGSKVDENFMLLPN